MYTNHEAMGNRQWQKYRPWKELRAGGERAKIFSGIWEEGKKTDTLVRTKAVISGY